MSEALPDPLVPAHVDLRGYEFMPLFGERLRTSDFDTKVTDEEFRAAFWLWWSAWWQLPAASLPDDDRQLCKLANLGRDLRRWRRVKAAALHGFVLCSDGRLYHSFLSPYAIEAFAKKRSAEIKGALGGKKSKENRQQRGSSATTTSTSPSATTATSPSSSPSSTNRSEVNTPPTPPTENPGQNRRPDSRSFAKAQHQIAEQHAAAELAAPPPGGLTPSQFAKAAVAQAKSKPQSFEDIDP